MSSNDDRFSFALVRRGDDLAKAPHPLDVDPDLALCADGDSISIDAPLGLLCNLDAELVTELRDFLSSWLEYHATKAGTPPT